MSDLIDCPIRQIGHYKTFSGLAINTMNCELSGTLVN